jgi:hypothetical protein
MRNGETAIQRPTGSIAKPPTPKSGVVRPIAVGET